MIRLALLLAITGCVGPFAPAEFWCSETTYWAPSDTLAPPDSVTWALDSTVVVMSEDGACPDV